MRCKMPDIRTDNLESAAQYRSASGTLVEHHATDTVVDTSEHRAASVRLTSGTVTLRVSERESRSAQSSSSTH